MEILGKGAEAEIYKEGNKIIKDRISKGYRLKDKVKLLLGLEQWVSKVN